MEWPCHGMDYEAARAVKVALAAWMVTLKSKLDERSGHDTPTAWIMRRGSGHFAWILGENGLVVAPWSLRRKIPVKAWIEREFRNGNKIN